MAVTGTVDPQTTGAAARRPGLWRLDFWNLAALLIAALVAMPVLSVIWLALHPSDDIWPHLVDTVLLHYVVTTALLMLGVGIGTMLIGTGAAWLVTMYGFRGRRVFEWALLLPLAMPGYIVAYVYTDLLDYAGPVQIALRDLFGWASPKDYWFPEIRSLPGAIIVLTLTLYPYVYLLVRNAFLEQSVSLFEASRTLGEGRWRSFRRIALPMAWPAIAVGVILALMETLNDYGTVDFFAVNSFTVGIVNVWTNMNSTSGAAQMATSLLVVVALLLWLERRARRRRRFHGTTFQRRALARYPLPGLLNPLATAACLLPLLFGFLVPAAILANYAVDHYQITLDQDYFGYLANSLSVSVMAAAIAIVVGLFLGYAGRLGRGPTVRIASRIASAGYAVPGAVLAVGLIVPLAGMDNALDGWARATFGVSTGLILSGTIAALTFGYVVRFLALSLGSVEAGLERIPGNLDDAAKLLGHGAGTILRRVHLPLLRGSILTAAVIVFVDAMKELPMTVLLRPFNFETLATFVHQYASDELLAECSFAALTIVAAGMLPVILLSRAIRRTRSRTSVGA